MGIIVDTCSSFEACSTFNMCNEDNQNMAAALVVPRRLKEGIKEKDDPFNLGLKSSDLPPVERE